MPKKLILALFIILILFVALLVFYKPYSPAEKVYIAIEGDGKIAVFDPVKKRIIKNIDLSIDHEGGKLKYSPHNIQVAPDGKTVWVSANVEKHVDGHSLFLPKRVFANGEDEHGAENKDSDQVVIIDPKLDVIIKRIDIAKEAHLAHVVLTPDNSFAYATAQKEGAVYKIDARKRKVEKKIEFGIKSEPHGIRIAPDRSSAYVALLSAKSLGIIDLKTDLASKVPLAGAAVQTGVSPDGKYVVVSLYDTKQLALYSIQTKAVSYINLPQAAKGPVQMYATPDSQFIYLADQGYYFEQPTGNLVYKIDIAQEKVVKEIKAGSAPHGVVVSKDGKFVYITNLLSGDISIIDAVSDQEVERIKVGKEPNGISIWSETLGGTP